MNYKLIKFHHLLLLIGHKFSSPICPHRDQFYELVREWQEKHLTPGWSVAEAQTSRIHSLLGLTMPLANHIHFARLFQSQLIQVSAC